MFFVCFFSCTLPHFLEHYWKELRTQELTWMWTQRGKEGLSKDPDVRSSLKDTRPKTWGFEEEPEEKTYVQAPE